MPTPSPTPPPTNPPSGPLSRWLRDPAGSEHRWLAHLVHHLAGVAHVLLALGVAIAALAAAYLTAAEIVRAGWARHGRWITIAPPAEPDPAGGLALWRMLGPLLTARTTLIGRRPPVAFEAWADTSGLRLGLWVSPTVSAQGVAHAVEAAWPGAHADIATPPTLPPSRRVSGGKATLAAPDWFPLDSTDTGGDPLRGVLACLATDAPADAVVMQVLARPATGRRIAQLRRAARAIRRGQPPTGLGRLLDLLRTSHPTSRPSTGTDPLALADVREITTKAASPPHFQVTIRYAVTGPPGRHSRRQRRARLRQIAAAFGLFTARNHLVGRHLSRPAATIAHRRQRRGFLLSAAELAGLAHLPTEPAGYGLPTAPARTVAPPPEVAHA